MVLVEHSQAHRPGQREEALQISVRPVGKVAANFLVKASQGFDVSYKWSSGGQCYKTLQQS